MTPTVDEAIARVDRAAGWVLVDTVPLDFVCHHPRGIDRADGTFFVSGSEILEPAAAVRGADGTSYAAGRGRAHLFEMSPRGRLLRHWDLGEDTVHHAGGLTHDGQFVWVTVAEERPDSRSIVYRLDPASGEVEEMFRYPDHLAGIARDPETGLLHTVTWGGRRILVLSTDGEPVGRTAVPGRRVGLHDCVAVAVRSPTGRAVTVGATDFEVAGADRLRLYALPDDSSAPGAASLLVLEAALRG
ncbi:DUF6454 family protein [Streptomyces sp. NPDC101234]|uniref:DUF6454 family protein n=1 Tax=Streptomyces sp. NPDC101234 TaxID=3366138 RepID=UPI0038193C59